MRTPHSTPLPALRAYLDRLLSIGKIADYPNALNGLQVEHARGTVTRIGAAVDGCAYTLKQAAKNGVDLLLVHHGLFWSGLQPVTGPAYRKLKTALEGNVAVYSAHLPLDLHARFGNNALLCQLLGLKGTKPFFIEKGQAIGLSARTSLTRTELVHRLEKAVRGPVKLCPGGSLKAGRVGVVTGGAGGEIFRAAAEGVDTFITGEGPHWTYTAAEELGINVLYGGHYATETFGVRALAEHLSRKYRLPWEFIDHPTGL